MRRRWLHLTRRNDKAFYSFSGDKRSAAVDVCALMVTLFRRVRKVAACASVCGKVAFRTVKHGEHLILISNSLILTIISLQNKQLNHYP
nr:MAG TPA: hypothetical protein [Caudoviricetes sp.]